MSDIGDKLKKLREEKGYTPEEIARQLHFTKSVVWSYELGKREPSHDHLCQMAQLYGVTVEDILKEEKHKLIIDLQLDKTWEDYKFCVGHMELSKAELEDAILLIKARRMVKNQTDRKIHGPYGRKH
ncbi:helix-turn-helix domain-containing protein [Oceanobacillus kapialis]|uniref:Helix-turn-helix domain-containing protein n=1 Tax=Oceanobacillus kapialis TaxID=481353 RepID=A0ABW5Q2U0_9BACI